MLKQKCYNLTVILLHLTLHLKWNSFNTLIDNRCFFYAIKFHLYQFCFPSAVISCYSAYKDLIELLSIC